jgi:outer membrane usher protein
LLVGSDYNVTALGRLLNSDGEPVSLVSGTATELAHPDQKVTLFTNREGRFGAVGLAPGKWRVEMVDDQHSVFVIDVPARAEGVLRLGDIKASKGE